MAMTPGAPPRPSRPTCPSRPGRRRALIQAAGAAAAALWPAAALRSQPRSDFPNRPITLWVPWPAGGATDLTLRILAEVAGERLGQKVLIENRPGAGGTLVMPVLQQAAPDGYTIAQMPQPVFRAPWVHKVTWDPLRDTTPIIQISGVTFGILVPASSAFHRVADLFEFARQNPGRLTIATNGVGTTPHLVLEQLFGERGLRYVHIPYKGTSEQMLNVSSGQVMAGVNSNGFAPYVDSGQLRLLATFGAERSQRWPQVPTLKELGYGIVASSPYGVAGPAGMPDGVVQTLHDAFKAAMFDPRHVAELAKYDQALDYLGPADYGRAMRAAYEAEREAAEKLGLARKS